MIKELIENSIDAQSTFVSVIVKGGGLEWIQIQDNGKGIDVKDLPIVCERFTTSKLICFDDLKTISTFGFRGEALASISYVSVVTITTKTASSTCAYKLKYHNGSPIPFLLGGSLDPLACAGTIGTTIVVEDLFHNVQIRKQSLKNSNDEYQRILEVVAKYSIHYGDMNVGFLCKKHGSGSSDVFTNGENSTIENIRSIYGHRVFCELIPILHSNPNLFCSISGYITNSSFVCKKSTFIVFINNRLVDCKAVRLAVEAAYDAMVMNHSNPFVYLAMRLLFLNLIFKNIC